LIEIQMSPIKLYRPRLNLVGFIIFQLIKATMLEKWGYFLYYQYIFYFCKKKGTVVVVHNSLINNAMLYYDMMCLQTKESRVTPLEFLSGCCYVNSVSPFVIFLLLCELILW